MRETRKVNYNFKIYNSLVSFCNFTLANSLIAFYAPFFSPSFSTAYILPLVKLSLNTSILLALHALYASITPNTALQHTSARSFSPESSYIAAYTMIYFTDYSHITNNNILRIFTTAGAIKALSLNVNLLIIYNFQM